MNVKEIKTLIFGEFFPFYQNKCEEIKQNNIFTIIKLSPFSNSLKKRKELFDLIISKTSSDDSDFPRVSEIALFLLYFTFINHRESPILGIT